ncbi:MAG: Trk family potassium uptake protein [Syntrophomonadaceae bacterium]|nr:Trk family potassium uptake protein [Syntrophomonadaceae bacterium]
MFSKLNPAQILVTGFTAAILIGSILLTMPISVKSGEVNFLTSFFTATSAICVTGLVVVDTATHWTAFGQVVIMLLFQIGGLGIMSFSAFSAFLMGRKFYLKERLAMQYSLNKSSLDKIASIFKYLLMFSFIIEFIGALLLFLHWFPVMGIKKALWFGIFHSISAFNNAGIDLFGNFASLTGLKGDIPLALIISALFIIGGLGFIVVYEIMNYRQYPRISLHSRIVLITTGILLLGGSVLFGVLENNNLLQGLSIGEKVISAFFQTATRTCGFTMVDMADSSLPTQILLMFMMFVGGAPGSTAGGIKVTTLAILFLAMISNLRGRDDIEVFERRIAAGDYKKAITIFILACVFIALLVFLISIGHDFPLNIILFEVISAAGTVGLSLGITPYLDTSGQLLLIIAMFLGRVGPLTIAYSMIYGKKPVDFRYAESRVMVG